MDDYNSIALALVVADATGDAGTVAEFLDAAQMSPGAPCPTYDEALSIASEMHPAVLAVLLSVMGV